MGKQDYTKDSAAYRLVRDAEGGTKKLSKKQREAIEKLRIKN